VIFSTTVGRRVVLEWHNLVRTFESRWYNWSADWVSIPTPED
jgi:hypothetical protein